VPTNYIGTLLTISRFGTLDVAPFDPLAALSIGADLSVTAGHNDKNL
jgi:hypothetical protein